MKIIGKEDEEDNFNLDGLRDLPGISPAAITELSDQLAPLQEITKREFGHGKILRWYHGTIAQNVTDNGYATDIINDWCTKEEEGEDSGSCGSPIENGWYTTEAAACNRQYGRKVGGYNRSLRIAGKNNTKCIETASDQPSIDDDRTLVDFNGLPKIFNGRISLSRKNTPGWDFQGGSTPIANLYDIIFDPHLNLTSDRNTATHNWMYIPGEGVNEISFWVKITKFNQDNQDRLLVFLGDGDNKYEHMINSFEGDAPCNDLRMKTRMSNYVRCSFSVSDFRGKTRPVDVSTRPRSRRKH